MVNEFIYNIEFSTNNQDIISIFPSSFKNFYIANIDENGDEISYGINEDALEANYFMIKILNDKSYEANEVINRIKSKKDITKLSIYFTNGRKQVFDIPIKRIRKDNQLINNYEELFEVDDDLGIIITDKNIKYKKELFV